MSDEQQGDEPMRRPRGRHRGLPAPAPAPAADGWRARLAAAAAPVVASVEPRLAVAAEWLFERRLHVLIVAASVATIAMIGGAVALISFAGAPLIVRARGASSHRYSASSHSGFIRRSDSRGRLG